MDWLQVISGRHNRSGENNRSVKRPRFFRSAASPKGAGCTSGCNGTNQKMMRSEAGKLPEGGRMPADSKMNCIAKTQPSDQSSFEEISGQNTPLRSALFLFTSSLSADGYNLIFPQTHRKWSRAPPFLPFSPGLPQDCSKGSRSFWMPGKRRVHFSRALWPSRE